MTKRPPGTIPTNHSVPLVGKGEVAELTGEPGVLPELLENEVVNKEKDHGSNGHRVGKRRRTALPEGRLKTV